mmetsp:Transcript_14571/g.39930  ORF Transcript_14571/g.39930 Transcript_14571/m.39930 type:complete len:625 (+) Transcript_14571:67-1941(+)|eukprot:CAMPEP_0176283608 /NCGR_PEP_ID=MMETSP0121_2-20121125/51401_1 /TAXON_ID=160619 /ORGANISM="Kryptoperidinium foliaceum, Strain CCMP 1326" /LENGTH=624 /DNA_ID=CAMNT_0017623985 /DNA_START=8 /DNA_END=1882 /DNA_ORIENTATION=+
MASCSSPSGESQNQDLMAVAVEIQRMLEASGYKPLPVSEIGKTLSMQSLMVLLQYAIGLLSVIEMHPKLFAIIEVDGGQMVSLKGVPWLGPRLPASEEAKVASGCAPPTECCGETPPSTGGIMQGIPRGKALEMMGELAEMPAVQEALQEVAGLLLATPTRTLLVSEIGSHIGQSTRGVLRSVKLRVAQLLQCFPNDFLLSGQGPATAVTFCHFELRAKFVPQPSVTELNNGRYYRLLKFSADITERYTGAKSTTVREVQAAKDAILFVDCRSDAERGVSIIPDSVPMSQVSDMQLEAPHLVVGFCCTGAVSAEWCEGMADSIWAYKIRYLAGGMAAWAHHSGSLVDPATSKPTTKVHCWLREVAPFFPVPGSGYEVLTDGVPASKDALAHPSSLRHARLRNLAWEVRLRYWPSVFCIEAADFKTQLDLGNGPNYLLVDCRTPEERQVSTIGAPGAMVISADELRRRAPEYISAYATIVTFCTIGGRSGTFCKRLVDDLVEFGQVSADQTDGLRRKIVNILGGMAAWLHVHGGLVDTMGQPTNQLHPWCRAFLDMFPLEDLDLVFDEFRPVPQDALSLIACKVDIGDAVEAVPQTFVQMCSVLPPEVINDSLTRAMQSCEGYED